MNQELTLYIEELVSDNVLSEVINKYELRKWANSNGYYYLLSMVQKTAEDMSLVVGSVEELREEVAKVFGVSSATVARTTRHIFKSTENFKTYMPKTVINILAEDYVNILRNKGVM